MKFGFLGEKTTQLLNHARRKFFLPPSLLLLGKERVEFRPGPGKKVNIVVSRELMRHDTFSFPTSVPQQQLKKALALAVQRWAPFKMANHAAIWSGHRASVYAWDAARLTEMVTAAGHDPAGCKFVPETFHRPRGTDGARIVACIDGFEGQVWRNGFLCTSRWWQNQPSTHDWMSFVRSTRDLGENATQDRRIETELTFLELPWSASTAAIDNAFDLFDTTQSRLWLASAAAAFPIFLVAQLTALTLTNATLDAEQTRLMQASSSVRAERDALIANLDNIDRLVVLDRRPTQFEVINRASTLIAGAPATISDWTFDVESLEISLESQTELEATRYIEIFERDPMFEGVAKRTVPQPLILRLKMDLTDAAEPTT